LFVESVAPVGEFPSVRRTDRVLAALAGGLDAGGVIEESRLRETVALAWPRTVTGFAIMSKRTVDLAVVGLALGSTAVAGLSIAAAFWVVGKLVGVGLAGGTIALVSQRYGGDDTAGAARVVEASLLLAVLLAVPIVAALVGAARPLVALLGRDPGTVGYGATYLAIVAPGLAFEYVNLIASRTYAGAGDTRTPMAVRAGGAGLNVLLSVALGLGAGWGVAGAAVGTTLATAAVAATFVWGLTGRAYPIVNAGACPTPVGVGRRDPAAGRLPDAETVRDLCRVSAPLVGRWVAEGAVVFPLLAIAATFGPVVVAALGVARQVRDLLGSFSWGLSIASSTLVGQALGAGEESVAEAYGGEITRLSLGVYVFAAGVVLVAAGPIAAVFVDDPAALPVTAAFVRAAAVSAVPFGVGATVVGALRGAGDTRVPFAASVIGGYAIALPVAWLGTVTPAGVLGLQAALVLVTGVPAVINAVRFRTDRWKAVSRSYRPNPSD
jgi:putative MATE family efflux protein